MKKLLTTAACALALTGMACAQFEMPAAKTSPWQDLKFDRKKMVRLNMPNTGVEVIVRFFSNASGISILKDPGLIGNLSLTTPKAVTLNQAFGLLAAALDLKGYELANQDDFLIVRPKPKTPTRGGMLGGPGFTAGGPSMIGGPGGGTQARSELRVYTLEFASATSVAKTINEVFGQSSGGANFAGGGPGGGNFPGGGGGPVQFGPGGPGGTGGNGGNAGGGPGGGAQGFPGRGGAQATAAQATVKASAEEYSNSVIVNAPATQQTQVAAFIKQIDRDMKQPYTTETYPLTFAAAEDLVTTVENVLKANSTKGRGSTSNSGTQNVDQRFLGPFASSSNNSNQSQGLVSADTRSNQLIVTTTEQNQLLIARLIGQLDKEIHSQNSTVVVPLANARASDIADLLNKAFSKNGSSSSSSSSSSSNRSSSSNSNSNNRNNGSNFSLPGSNQVDPNSLYVQMKDANATAGELATDVSVAQGGFFGFPGGGQSSSSSSSKSNQNVARDAQGRVIRTSELTGRVTIVADPNTNSLIVVGDPEAVGMIQQILDQLDRIPEQVMIETMIVEATLDSSSKFGVQWSFAQNKAFGNSGTTGTAEGAFGLTPSTATGFKYTLAGGDLSVFLNAMKSDTNYRVLSTPRIFTSNNVEASINISQSIPYVTSQREDSNGNLTFNYSFQDVGIVLTVTPRISPSGAVTLDVNQTANDLQGYTDFNAPIVNQREANTTVSVKDGETIVLGGIMRNAVTATTNKIPLLGDIPLLGQLFRSTTKTQNKTELLVFLTPRIVRNSDDAKKIYEDQKGQLTSGKKKGG